MKRKKILILATGGTIACVATQKGFMPGIEASELAAMVPELSEIADIGTRQLMNVDSSDMRPHDWKTMARAVSAAVSEGYDGVVITHGTDTMCYTASALSFMLPAQECPVILTGAQKPPGIEDSDAPSNLKEACIAACSDELKGVSLAFNHKLIHGPRSFKMYSKNYDAYVSRNYPVLGIFENDVLKVQKQPFFAPSRKKLDTSICEEVFLLKITPSTNPDIIEFIGRSDYKGLVIEGFGTGGISNLGRGMYSAIEHLIQKEKVPVLMLSQCPYEGVNLAVYGIGDQARELGIIPGNDMTTEAAMVKMMHTLAKFPDDLDKVRQRLMSNCCDEISTDFVDESNAE